MSILISESTHEQLELLVYIGLSNIDALSAARVVPIIVIGLEDRGVVSPGRRVDMVVAEGGILQDIMATRRIQTVWIRRVEVERWDDTEI
ncbi:uncharacterized protein BKA55DRAFT_523991 [Fusarium redolens]|jgi:imidazolonepropionase-like amidohydrolase|uniref:Amidohydrolase-related domain-containing protein n=1 Tax=Fusarium redolens TaxID=48865 RepID=A0A9P9G3Z1_FUSRE|nr:uncharacterized protein BKA55DRAFT_523991 [Fusarium redolens]KAH7231803.1 hypothetical protein BKA55DRAFT_523991 [Fusarium redolens]